MAMGNITDAPINLNALIMENPIFTTPMMMSLVSQHYTQEIVGQVT
jgi:vacuolar protein sorting-associated protein 13A/C